MAVHEFVKQVYTQITALPSEVMEHDDVLVRMESRSAYNRLKRRLEIFMSSQHEADQHGLSPFVLFLEDRWRNIIGSNATYELAAHTRANRACQVLAEVLAKQMVPVSPKTLLMRPSIEVLPMTLDEGREKFCGHVLPLLKDTEQFPLLINDKRDLVELMVDYIPRNQWIAFAADLPFDELKRLLLHVDLSDSELNKLLSQQDFDKTEEPAALPEVPSLPTSSVATNVFSFFRSVGTAVSKASAVSSAAISSVSAVAMPADPAYVAYTRTKKLLELEIKTQTRHQNNGVVLDYLGVNEPSKSYLDAWLLLVLTLYKRNRLTGGDTEAYFGKALSYGYAGYVTGVIPEADRLLLCNMLLSWIADDKPYHDLREMLQANGKNDAYYNAALFDSQLVGKSLMNKLAALIQHSGGMYVNREEALVAESESRLTNR